VVTVSTVASALFPLTSMVWSGSQSLSAGVAVNAAVNVHNRGSSDYSECRVSAGHSHGPPTAVNALFCGEQTYYVLAGSTPVLVHNSNCSPSQILGDNLVGSGVARPADTAAHHIVAHSDVRADPARRMLAGFGIDINAPENGVFLPRFLTSPNPTGAAVHSTTHTDAYYRTVNEMLGWARNADEARDVLGYIRNQLQAGSWPP
jgi:hypothetical protein